MFLILLTNSPLISIPTVLRPDFANDNAVGKPILPIPITQTDISFLSINFLISFSSSEKISFWLIYLTLYF